MNFKESCVAEMSLEEKRNTKGGSVRFLVYPVGPIVLVPVIKSIVKVVSKLLK